MRNYKWQKTFNEFADLCTLLRFSTNPSSLADGLSRRRSLCQVPPVGNLWNLGESKNTIRKLADLQEDVDLFELSDDVPPVLSRR